MQKYKFCRKCNSIAPHNISEGSKTCTKCNAVSESKETKDDKKSSEELSEDLSMDLYEAKIDMACIATTINAIASHHGITGVKGKGPKNGMGILSHLKTQGLVQHPVNADGVGMTVKQFVDAHKSGTHYISTPGHAMAVVNGKLHDSSKKGANGRKIVCAIQFSKKLKEDAPTNCAGGGAIASIGVGPDGEPPKKTKKSTMVKRKSFSQFVMGN